jgi:hypothetical protein
VLWNLAEEVEEKLLEKRNKSLENKEKGEEVIGENSEDKHRRLRLHRARSRCGTTQAKPF